ncbi:MULTISPECIES: SDR family oxidoreductase [Psychrobacillus]|uniref:SDR family oxidoreductase n=1 Tax=Psychrobacillus TaxID=1221880 RepID=UPI0030F8E3F4
MSIVITGATGHYGNRVIQELLKTIPASEIIASVRNVEKADALAELGIEVRHGDYMDYESMKTSFEDASKVLFVSGPDSDNTLRIRQHANVVQAARDAGVKHIAYTGYAFGETSQIDLAHVHMATEYAIRSTGVPYTFLRNSLYSDVFIDESLAGSVSAGEIVTNTGDGKLNAVSREDLALAAAAVLTGEGHENKSYNLVNPSPWTFDELAEVVSEVSGKQVSHKKVSFDEMKDYLGNVGLPAPVAELIAGIYHTVAAGETGKTSNDLTNLIGQPTPLKKLVQQALKA